MKFCLKCKESYHHPVWWVGSFGYLGSEITSPAGPIENVFSLHPTSRLV